MPEPATAPHLALVGPPGHEDTEADHDRAEAEARRALAALAARRRARREPRVTQDYRFTDEEGREVGLLDLFGPHETLVTYFWKYGPHRDRPCPDCTRRLDPLEANARALSQRVGLVVLGRSPAPRQRAFATARGWTQLRFCETQDDAARDLGALKKGGEESPMFVVFGRDAQGHVRVLHAAEMTPQTPLHGVWELLETPS